MQSSLFEDSFNSPAPGWETIALADAVLKYRRQFYTQTQSDFLFSQLFADTFWRQESLRFGGKLVPVPRLQAWYGDSQALYGYSGLHMAPLPWTPTLMTIRQQLESELQQPFNSVLLNLYRDGQDSVAWHSDDEIELGPNPVIASLSFGADRTFELKPLPPRAGKKSVLTLHDGSLLFMGEGLQKHWSHQLPKEPGITRPRINLTFRFIHAVA